MQLQAGVVSGRIMSIPIQLAKLRDSRSPEPLREVAFWKQNPSIAHVCGRIAFQHSTLPSRLSCPTCEEDSFLSSEFQSNFVPIETFEEEVFREAS